MAKRIPHSLIEEIRLKTDIVTVIGSYFNLQHKGSTIKALCPFHKEKTPSFIVNPQRQIYHCFGCGTGGDVFRFVMEYEKVDFMMALKMLAQRAGVRLTFEADEGPDKPNKEVLYEIHEKVAQLYHQILFKKPEAEKARQYLKSRHFSKSAVEEFQMGFAPDQWDTVLKWAGKQYSRERLEAAGLIVTYRDRSAHDEPSCLSPADLSADRSSESRRADQEEVSTLERVGPKRDEPRCKSAPKVRQSPSTSYFQRGEPHCYDRFRNRLMFPIQDEQGRVVGFSGRVLDDTAKSAKYVNTPDTVLFHKGRILFALNKARRAIVEAREAIVCEGQIDVIRCHMAGFKTAVAAQGTAFTEDHARILKRYADAVVLVFDADRAGQDAVLRAADTFLQMGLAVRIASLPVGEDPDSLISRKDGKAFFQKILRESKTALDFQIDVLNERDSLDTEAGLIRATSTVLAMINRTPNAVQQARLLQQASARLGVPEYALRKEFQNSARRGRYRATQPETTSELLRPIKEVALAEHVVAEPLLSDLVRTYLPLDLVTDTACRQVIHALLESEETGQDLLSILSERDNDERELSRFAAQVLAAPEKVKGGLATNEESVKSLILGIRTSALIRRRKEIEKLQMVSRTAAGKKRPSAEEKALEMEYCQLRYDIAKLKHWETAVPIMEIT